LSAVERLADAGPAISLNRAPALAIQIAPPGAFTWKRARSAGAKRIKYPRATEKSGYPSFCATPPVAIPSIAA
jgi:hypothetical protein